MQFFANFELFVSLLAGAKIVICNALSYNKTSDDLQDLLKCMATQKVDKDNAFVAKIDEAVLYANNDKEIRRKAEMYDLKLQDTRDEGIAIGMEQGKEHWIHQGMQRGKKQGIKQYRALVWNR